MSDPDLLGHENEPSHQPTTTIMTSTSGESSDGDNGNNGNDQEILDGSSFPEEQTQVNETSLSQLVTSGAPNASRGGEVFLHFWNLSIEKSWPLLLLLAVLVLWPSGAIAFGQFQQKTDSTFHNPVPHSPSAKAQAAFDKAYPASFNNPMHPSLILLLESKDGATDLRTSIYARSFALELGGYLKATITPDTSVDWIQILSFFSFQELNLTILGDQLMSSNGTMAILQIQYLLPDDNFDTNTNIIPANDSFVSANPGQLLNDMLQGIEDYECEQNNTTSSEFEIYKTGLKYFSTDLRASMQQDLKRMDRFVLPITLVLVGFVLPRSNPRIVWIIPLVGILSTISCWSIIMSKLAEHIQITQFTPSIMMSLTLGMSIDYSIFLLARYLEAVVDTTKTRSQVIQEMLSSGGQVVVLSGLTLMCTFLGLVVLPLGMLKSVGVGAAVAIGSCIVSNLIIIPVLLYSRLGAWVVLVEDDDAHQIEAQEMHEPLLDTNVEEQRGVESVDEHGPIRSIVPRKSLWIRLSRQLLHRTRGPIIFLLTFGTTIFPVTINAMRVNSSGISFDLVLPTNSPSLQAYNLLGTFVGPGRLAPFRLLFDGSRSKSTILSSTGFDIMHLAINELLKIEKPSHCVYEFTNNIDIGQQDEFEWFLGDTDDSDDQAKFSGIATVNNKPISYSQYKAAKLCANNSVLPCPFESFRALDYVDTIVTSHDEMSTFLNIELPYSPFSEEGIQWLEKARMTLQELSSDNQYESFDLFLEGPSAIAHDAVTAVYEHFPAVVAITFLVVFCLMGMFFKSIIPPLRSTISIVCTLTFSFGAATLVYQDGLMVWTGVHSLAAIERELCWLVPVMSFSIIVGLALDYDVFLVSRILEYRCDGYMHFSSIAAGLDSTGGIITSAGLVMAFSFGSLLGSQSPALYQWSFLLTSAVLLDTFVVRTIIVPTLTGFAKKYCWYPRKFTEGHIRLWGFDEIEPSSGRTERGER